MSRLSAALPAQTAGGGTSVTVIGVYEPDEFSADTIQAIELTPPSGYSTVTGAASNNVTFNVRQVRAGTVVATFATLTTVVGVSLAAEVPVAIPVTTQPMLAAGDVVDVQMVQNASGVAVGVGLVASVHIS